MADSPGDATGTGTIRLDTTLADLYRENGIQGPFVATTHCVFGRMDLHPAFPRELVYPEDEEPVLYDPDDEPGLARLRRVVLGLKPLRRAFGLGAMDVLLFAPHVTEAGAARALRQLPPDQRHRPRLVDLDGGDVPARLREATRGRRLLFWRPQGWMDDAAHDCLVDPRAMYDANSKLFLLASGMRTPPSEAVDLRAAAGDPGRPSCVFRARALPFVVKLPRAGCSLGTFLVRTEADRAALLASLAAYLARARAAGPAAPAVVLLSRYVDAAGDDLSAHFVVGAPGTPHGRSDDGDCDPLVVAVTAQTLAADDGRWVGGRIDYAAQADLRRRVAGAVRDAARRLPAGFVGWAGVDIVEDRAGGQWVVDLNARLTGSMPVCLMAGHFWRERGLPLAQFAAVEYGGGVDDVYARLAPRTTTGQVVVTATAAVDEDLNVADVVWAGRDAADLAEVERWLRQRLAASFRGGEDGPEATSTGTTSDGQ